jgi:hypothetical protein
MGQPPGVVMMPELQVRTTKTKAKREAPAPPPHSFSIHHMGVTRDVTTHAPTHAACTPTRTSSRGRGEDMLRGCVKFYPPSRTT